MHEEQYSRGRQGRGGGGRGYGHGGRGEGGGGGRGGTPLSELDPALTDVSRRVIGCAIEVHKGLGPGFEVEIYRGALRRELDDAGISYQVDHPIPVKYKGHVVGERRADMLIDNRFIIELMAVRMEIGGGERAALRALLRAADLELGLIINFGERRLKDGLVRVLNPDKLNAMADERDHHEEDEDHDDDDEHDDDEYEDDED